VLDSFSRPARDADTSRHRVILRGSNAVTGFPRRVRPRTGVTFAFLWIITHAEVAKSGSKWEGERRRKAARKKARAILGRSLMPIMFVRDSCAVNWIDILLIIHLRPLNSQSDRVNRSEN